VKQYLPSSIQKRRRPEVSGPAQARNKESIDVLGVSVGAELGHVRSQIDLLVCHRPGKIAPDSRYFQSNEIHLLRSGAAAEILERGEDILYAVGIISLIEVSKRPSALIPGRLGSAGLKSVDTQYRPASAENTLDQIGTRDQRGAIRMYDKGRRYLWIDFGWHQPDGRYPVT
jgi:hypothetical protein